MIREGFFWIRGIFIPQPFQKPAIATDIGMFAWLLGIVEQNPILMVIVIAVLGVALYFGWWNRRRLY